MKESRTKKVLLYTISVIMALASLFLSISFLYLLSEYTSELAVIIFIIVLVGGGVLPSLTAVYLVKHWKIYSMMSDKPEYIKNKLDEIKDKIDKKKIQSQKIQNLVEDINKQLGNNNYQEARITLDKLKSQINLYALWVNYTN
jgi:ABC-type multidrug transport system fused ATPase/permease subunit